MSAQPIPRITSEQYLAMERAAEFKSEYYGGYMYAMAGGTIPHAHIIANFTGALFQALKDGPCMALSSDARLRVPPSALFTYPDIMVVCGEAQFADDQNDTILNPTVIVEVLSKSTEGHDRGFKFVHYRTLDSFREYVLVSTGEARVEKFLRQAEGRWILSEFAGLGAVCPIESLDCRILLADIYHKVTFGEGQTGVR